MAVPPRGVADPDAPGWVRRHKLATVLLAVVMVGALGWVFGSSQDPTLDGGQTAENPDIRDATPQKSKGDADQVGDDDAKPSGKPSKSPKPRPTFLVAEITDGDTVQLANGESVRLVGIDSPEAGACGYLKATENLARLILGKRVRLAISDEDRDQYGRLLRYVNLGSLDAGLRQIQDGFAIARYDSRDGYGFHAREPAYIRADKVSPDFECPKPAPFAGPGNDCAPGYRPCIPAFPPDLDCADVDGPITVTGPDPHRLDADGDHIACESG